MYLHLLKINIPPFQPVDLPYPHAGKESHIENICIKRLPFRSAFQERFLLLLCQSPTARISFFTLHLGENGLLYRIYNNNAIHSRLMEDHVHGLPCILNISAGIPFTLHFVQNSLNMLRPDRLQLHMPDFRLDMLITLLIPDYRCFPDNIFPVLFQPRFVP